MGRTSSTSSAAPSAAMMRQELEARRRLMQRANKPPPAAPKKKPRPTKKASTLAEKAAKAKVDVAKAKAAVAKAKVAEAKAKAAEAKAKAAEAKARANAAEANAKAAQAAAKSAASASKTATKVAASKPATASTSSTASKKKEPPAEKTRPYDKYEVCPNNQSKCRTCKKKIVKDDVRVGKTAFVARYGGYYHEYYHKACFPQSLASLRLQSGTPQKEMARHTQEQQSKAQLIRQRLVLRQQLQQLRLEFAKRLKVQAFCIFGNQTLDDLVVKLPLTKAQLLQVYGFAEKRYQNFGKSILQVIQAYVKADSKSKPPKQQKQQQRQPSRAKSSQKAAASRDDTVAEEAVEVMGSMSVEAIVAQRFQEAAAKGQIISIDDKQGGDDDIISIRDDDEDYMEESAFI